MINSFKIKIFIKKIKKIFFKKIKNKIFNFLQKENQLNSVINNLRI